MFACSRNKSSRRKTALKEENKEYDLFFDIGKISKNTRQNAVAEK